MSKQDKLTTERNAKTLRELVRRPENKVCADCKRNDPRWASWNLGVFLCIRCSGIHRGMGTHISKVKSVDLDVWTPEQMESIQKWGNYRANLFWEAHLKRGHIPPDHKMESFIRSKYESRRWAMEGPIPLDPSILEKAAKLDEEEAAAAAAAEAVTVQQSAVTHATGPIAAATSNRQPASPATRQPHQLLSASYAAHQNTPTVRGQQESTVPPAAPPSAPPQALPAQQDLFSLDFHAPPPSSASPAAQQPRKDVKQDILSLFSAPTPNSSAVPMASASSGQGNAWGTSPPIVSMAGTSGVGAWGVSSGWGASAVPPAQPNVWGSSTNPTTAQQPNLFASSNDIWGGSAVASNGEADLIGSSFSTSSTAAPTTKKDDVFGDLWGGFK
ncbi:hypothetical protein AX16_009911 [Volvariella volvacea WC 439]|nr:hypothetical protein AX16_009911 [Volvariella volvacea WC 439]